MTAQLTVTAPLTKHIWDWRGFEIQYTVQGEGQPLVLIHGFGASLGHWRKNIPVLAAAGYRVYALDLLGFGESDMPAITYTLELWQGLLKDFWTQLIQEPAIFVGNSIGGVLTLMLLANYPDLAKGGVLLNCAGGLNHRPEELKPPLRQVMAVFTRVVSAPLLGPWVYSNIRQRFRIRGSLQQVYSDRSAITDELVDMIHRAACRPEAQKVFTSIITAPPGPRPEDLLPRVQQPLLVLWGEDDPWTPIAGAGIYRQRANDPTQPPLTFHSIPNTGHCPHDERPDIVNQLMVDWLGTILKPDMALQE